MQTIKILIVDDEARFREQVKELLLVEPNIEVAGEAADGREAICQARELKPDLILMDVRMPGLNGIDATRQLKSEMPAMRVIILSLYDVAMYKKAAIASGADGYLKKSAMVKELIPTIRRVITRNSRNDLPRNFKSSCKL
jgi:DNA-binding NarL/FixJ family response regulator